MVVASRVLVVDDDPKFRSFASQGLSESGYAVHTAGCVPSGLEVVARHAVDIVLLDMMMPGDDGHELLRELRRTGVDVPVIFVTARGDASDRIEGLREGADDYIVKPFRFAELTARIEAVLRRHHRLPNLRLGSLSIDVGRRIVRCGDREIGLSLKEFDLLTVLVRDPGVVKSRAELLREVWGISHDPGTNVIEVHVARVRRKIEVPDCPRIETVRGQGYRIVEDA